MQKYDRALLEGQLRHVAPKVVAIVDGDGAFAELHSVGHELFKGVGHRGVNKLYRYALLAAQHIAAGVARHRDEPAEHVAIVFEDDVAFQELDERLLNHVVGRFRVIEHAARQAKNRVAVLVQCVLNECAVLQRHHLLSALAIKQPLARAAPVNAAPLSNTCESAKAQREFENISKNIMIECWEKIFLRNFSILVSFYDDSTCLEARGKFS